MDCLDFDNVKAEKAEAMRRFNRRQTLKKLLVLLCEVLLAFFSLSWLSKGIPDALKIAGDLVRGFVLILDRPLFCFVLVNLLILVIFALSCRKNNSSNIYDEFAESSRSATGNMTEELVKETVVDKHMIIADNAVLKKRAVVETATDLSSERAVSPVQQDGLSTVTQTESTASSVTVIEKKRAVGAVMEAKKKGGYQRSRSEMSNNFGNKTLPELRRSETTIRGQMVVASTESPRKSMDHLSSEEFRLTVESFIAEQKKTLIRENRASLHGYVEL